MRIHRLMTAPLVSVGLLAATAATMAQTPSLLSTGVLESLMAAMRTRDFQTARSSVTLPMDEYCSGAYCGIFSRIEPSAEPVAALPEAPDRVTGFSAWRVVSKDRSLTNDSSLAVTFDTTACLPLEAAGTRLAVNFIRRAGPPIIRHCGAQAFLCKDQGAVFEAVASMAERPGTLIAIKVSTVRDQCVESVSFAYQAVP